MKKHKAISKEVVKTGEYEIKVLLLDNGLQVIDKEDIESEKSKKYKWYRVGRDAKFN